MAKEIFHKIEGKYYEVLRLVADANGVSGDASRAQLPVFLEEKTTHRLFGRGAWFISGISGSGKTTVARILEKQGFKKVPNVTTRRKRTEERDNNFIFTDEAKFKEWEMTGLLFDPHLRNKTWHAILRADIENLSHSSRIYADKSVTSLWRLVSAMPDLRAANFLYVLPPTFWELYERIHSREGRRRSAGGEALSTRDIFDRFEEEIADMENSAELPYAYLVNDTVARVEEIVTSVLRKAEG